MLKMDDRKKPENSNCPNCDVKGMVEQVITAPNIVSGVKSNLRMAGSGWNDVLKGIKKASGRDNTIKT